VLVGANFEHARCERLNLTMANLATAVLAGIDLRGSLFGGCDTAHTVVECDTCVRVGAKALTLAQRTCPTPISPIRSYKTPACAV
jgi:uncharacterized protein YjbI with pentapeptide repeats